jgi:hypothetical protein
MNNSFSLLVRKKLDYLISQYKYSFREELHSTEPFGDCLIEFWSSKTIVSIRLDRMDIVLLLGPLGEVESARLSLEVLVDFMTSRKKQFTAANFDFHGSFEERIEFHLERYASILREYCDPFLRGDFSLWIDALKYYVNYMRNYYCKLTGSELSPEAYKSIEEYINLKESK